MKTLQTCLVGLLVVSACSNEKSEEVLPDNRIAISFTAEIDPTAGTFDVAYGQSVRGVMPMNVVQDGIPDNGPANSLELVSTNTGNGVAGCGTAGIFCADVRVRSFYGQPLHNVYVELISILPAFGNDGQNSEPPQMGLSDTFGLWRYGTIAANGNMTRTWQLGDTGTAYVVQGHVMADMVAPPNCNTILATYPATPDGTYTIDPDGMLAVDVFCDMTRHGGGWTQIGRIGQGISASSDFASDLNLPNLALPPPAMPTEYTHINLNRFNALGGGWQIRSATDAGPHFQYVFFRPVVGATCLPGLAGTNWWGTPTNTLLEHLTMTDVSGFANTTWLSVLPYAQVGGTNLWMFGYRSTSNSGDCIDGGTQQTRYCHSPSGPISNEGGGRTGTYTAAFGMADGIGHSWGTQATYWIR